MLLCDREAFVLLCGSDVPGSHCEGLPALRVGFL